MSTIQIKVEIRTIFNLAGDIHGKSELDLACGYGLFSREYRNRGASNATPPTLQYQSELPGSK
ncbi:hypothetical protein SAMN02982990_01563 [Photorhabdus luminescens]|uniref:Uncharacterized protein n=1 Tax=Photorhabdus luminescens TaxID=29488 RepID=A0A1G5QEK1_PHOLU|nr:hypothetical protein SAMN02982990_01563 [Photorhabdus luminescens]